MKKVVLITLMLIGIVGPASAQHDDLYFVPQKKSKTVSSSSSPVEEKNEEAENTTNEKNESTSGLSINEDAYNRRWSYLTDEGNTVSELAQSDEGFVLITEEGDTMWMNTDTLHLTRVPNDEGWVNGFDGSDSDYEYAMRIIRFRNPRYAIPVSSPLYWDVIHGNALWPSWDWNIYDDGMYAYVFPTSSNWHYWDYMMSYPFGWNPWGNSWSYWGWSYGWDWHYGWNPYGWDWFCSPWHDPFHYSCYHGYYPGWHHGHYPIAGIGKPGWSGPKVLPNDRKATIAPTRSGTQDYTANRGSAASASATRSGTTSVRTGNSAIRNSSVRVVTNRTSSTERSSSSVRSSGSSRTGNDEMLRRSTGTSTISRGTTIGSNSRDSYTRQSSSRSSSGSSYNRPSSTRSTSSTSSRSSSSYSSSRSSGSSSYSSGSSSYSSGSSSYSSGSSRSSSYSSGSSYSGSSRSSGSSYSGGSSRSSGSSGSRR